MHWHVLWAGWFRSISISFLIALCYDVTQPDMVVFLCVCLCLIIFHRPKGFNLRWSVPCSCCPVPLVAYPHAVQLHWLIRSDTFIPSNHKATARSVPDVHIRLPPTFAEPVHLLSNRKHFAGLDLFQFWLCPLPKIASSPSVSRCC